LGQFAQLSAITAQRRKLARIISPCWARFRGADRRAIAAGGLREYQLALFQIVLRNASPARVHGAHEGAQDHCRLSLRAHPLFKLYRALGFKEACSRFLNVSGGNRFLAMFYAMNESDVERTCAAMREVLQPFNLGWRSGEFSINALKITWPARRIYKNTATKRRGFLR